MGTKKLSDAQKEVIEKINTRKKARIKKKRSMRKEARANRQADLARERDRNKAAAELKKMTG